MKHLNNKSETTLIWTVVVAVDYQTTQTGSRTTVTSKMELFVAIFDSFHSLTIGTKSSVLDFADILDPTLTSLAELDLNQFKAIFCLI